MLAIGMNIAVDIIQMHLVHLLLLRELHLSLLLLG
jgi:hypothetical protein